MYKLIVPAFLAALILFNGCKKWLDLKPESEIILDEYWQNEAQVRAVLAGCYKSLTSDGCMSRILLWGEGRSDNVEYFDTDDLDFKRMVIFDLYETNGYCRWGDFFKVINYCNTFLKFAPEVVNRDPNFTQAKLKPMEAEVKAIRALTYFYLVRAFRNVPWIEVPSENDQQDFSVPQNTETEVISFIIEDLNDALMYAPEVYAYTEYNKGRFTKNAIRALLADVYLWDQKYSQSIEMCNSILADQKLNLYDADLMLYNVFYRGNSAESIFELQFGEASENKQVNNIVRSYYGNYSDLSGRLIFSSFLMPTSGSIKSPFQFQVGLKYESLKNQDFRYYSFLFPFSISTLTPFKFSGAAVTQNVTGSSYSYVFRSNTPNWIVYRLADIILMKAEALVQRNNSSDDLKEAMRMVNTTYLRANPDLGTDSLKLEDYQTVDALTNLVLRERQREFLFEGKRWYDLMRLTRRVGNPGPLLSYVSSKFKDGGGLLIGGNSIIDALYLPVHKDELDANPKLVQNPYYKDLDLNASVK